MTHAGEKMVFCLIQFLDLFFLLSGKFVFLFIKPVQKQQQNTGKDTYQYNRDCGGKERITLGILSDPFRISKGDIIAEQRFRHAKQEEENFSPSLQGNADVNKAKYKPFRHSAVKPACCKKAQREKQKKQDCNDRSSCVDTFFLNADLHDCCHTNKAGSQD